MKMFSIIYLFWLLLLAVQYTLTAQLNVDGPNEFDELRVSNSQFQDTVNFHNLKPNIEAATRKAVGQQQQRPQLQIDNRIEKPAIAATKTPRELEPLFMETPNRKSAPSLRSQANSTTFNPKQQNLDPAMLSRLQGAFGQSKQFDACRPIKLRDFKNISLPTGELVIRDAEDRPCYTLTLRGYIKWNEDAFFPLRNFKVYQHTVVETPNGGASLGRMLNCSAATDCGSNSTTGLLLKQTRAFREEIIVFVDCGYLVLRTYALGPYISLESISFYRNPDQGFRSTAKLNRELVKFALPMKAENLIFSTDGTANFPLFIAPLVFIYTCSNRIELTGNNSVRLYLLKFEIQRTAYLISELGPTHTASGGESSSDKQKGLYDAMKAQKSLLNVVTKCPNPKGPNFSLYSMMDNGFQRLNETFARYSVESLKPQASKATHWSDSLELVWLGFRVTGLCPLVTLYLLQWILKKGIAYTY